jgi:hypothetical protein
MTILITTKLVKEAENQKLFMSNILMRFEVMERIDGSVAERNAGGIVEMDTTD